MSKYLKLLISSLTVILLCTGCQASQDNEPERYPDNNPEAFAEETQNFDIYEENEQFNDFKDYKEVTPDGTSYPKEQKIFNNKSSSYEDLLNSTAEIIISNNQIDKDHYRYRDSKYGMTVDLLGDVLYLGSVNAIDLKAEPYEVSENREFLEDIIDEDILFNLITVEETEVSPIKKFNGEIIEDYLKTKFNCTDEYIKLIQTKPVHCDSLQENNTFFAVGYFYKKGNYYLFNIDDREYESKFDNLKINNISEESDYYLIDYTIKEKYTHIDTLDVHAKLKHSKDNWSFVSVNATPNENK